MGRHVEGLGSLGQILGALLIVLTIGACATRPPTAAEIKSDRIDRAEDALEAQGYWDAFLLLADRSVSVNAADIGEIREDYPQFGSTIGTDLQQRVSNAKNSRDVLAVLKQIGDARRLELISEETSSALRSTLGEVAKTGNTSGDMEFVLTDDWQQIPTLTEPAQKQIMLARSLETLKKGATVNSMLTEAVFNLVKESGVGSDEFELVEQSLDDLPLNRSMLTQHVQELYPQFAQARLSNMTVEVFLKFDPEDRLLESELIPLIERKSDAIRLVNEVNDQTVVVTIGKLRFEERQVPEQTQTVMFADYQVDTLKAALLMPNGASYLYEYTSGGAEIEYAFDLRAQRGTENLYSNLIKDKVNRSYSYCSNARVQNVFGGVQPANWVANNQMQSQCAGSSSRTNPSELRGTVYSRLATEIVGIEAIAKIVALAS